MRTETIGDLKVLKELVEYIDERASLEKELGDFYIHWDVCRGNFFKDFDYSTRSLGDKRQVIDYWLARFSDCEKLIFGD